MLKILIEMDGGCVMNVTTNRKAQLCIVDWDVAMAGDSSLPKFDPTTDKIPHKFDEVMKNVSKTVDNYTIDRQRREEDTAF